MNKQYKLLGTNDESDTCEVCGKTNLKRVMWLEDEDGYTVIAGTDCGARLLGLKGNYKSVEEVATAAKKQSDYEKKLQLEIESATKMAIEFNDEVLIFWNNTYNSFYSVRGRGYDAAPERHRGSSFKKLIAKPA